MYFLSSSHCITCISAVYAYIIVHMYYWISYIDLRMYLYIYIYITGKTIEFLGTRITPVSYRHGNAYILLLQCRCFDLLYVHFYTKLFFVIFFRWNIYIYLTQKTIIILCFLSIFINYKLIKFYREKWILYV